MLFKKSSYHALQIDLFKIKSEELFMCGLMVYVLALRRPTTLKF